MSNWQQTLVAGVAVLGLSSPLAQALPIADLPQAVQQAVTENPDVKASWHAFEASADAVRASRGGYYPRLDLEGGIGHERQDPRGAASFSYDPWRTQLSLTQMLYDGFETRNTVRQFDHERKQRFYEFRDASETAALEATRAYLDVSRFQRLVELAKDNYRQHRALYNDIEQRARAGISRQVDVEQATARLALAETNLLTEATNLHDVSARFQRIVGDLPAPQLAEPLFDTAAIPVESRQALKQAYQGSPQLSAAIEAVQAAQAARQVRDAPMQPRLDLRLRHELEDNTDGVPTQLDTSAIELLFSYNLYRGGSDQARIRESEHRAEQAWELQRKACREVRQNLVIAHNDIDSLTEQSTYLDRNQISVGKARTQYRKQFDIGKRSLLDLLDTENEYFDVRRAWVNNQYDLMQAQARTLATMGQLVATFGRKSRGLDGDTAVPAAMKQRQHGCPLDGLPMMNPVDKEALLASLLGEEGFRDIGGNKLAFRMNAFFAYSSAELSQRYQPDVARAAQFLQRYPDVDAVIEGHTDSTGTDAFNQRLSEKRAQAVYQRLVKAHGIDPARLTARGFGESKPLASNETAKGRGQNRRVELVIDKPDSLAAQ